MINESPHDVEELGSSHPEEARLPVLLVLDTSAAMRGEPIEALRQGLQVFRDRLLKEPLVARRVDVGLIAFDSDADVMYDFVPVEHFEPPELEARGLSRTGRALDE